MKLSYTHCYHMTFTFLDKLFCLTKKTHMYYFFSLQLAAASLHGYQRLAEYTSLLYLLLHSFNRH